MFGFNLPGMDGYKTRVGAWAQLIAALLLAVSQLIAAANDCLQGVTALQACANSLPVLFGAVIVAGNGLAQLGLGHKLEKQNEAGI